jgi:hypothetical protein
MIYCLHHNHLFNKRHCHVTTTGKIRRLDTAFYVFLGLCFLTLSFIYIRLTIDDAFITFRYGLNLAETGAWTWNPGESPTEAYTNFTYAVLSVVPHMLGLDVVLFFKLVSLGLMCLFVYLIITHTPDKVSRYLALFAVAANPAFHIHLYSGLETPLFILLLYYVFLKVLTRESGSELPWSVPIALLLLPLTRPEGLAYTFALSFYFVYSGTGRRSRIALATVIGLIAAYWALRWWYFGYLFPNSFYAKKGSFIDLAENMASLLPVALASALLVSLFFDREGEKGFSRDRKIQGMVVLTVLTLVVYVLAYLRSHLIMGYANRFMFQIFFPLFLAFLSRLDWKRSRVPVYLAAGLSLLILSAFPPKEALVLANYYPRLLNAHAHLGKQLSKYEGYTLVVGDSGALPYYSGWQVIDEAGLGSPVVAHGEFDTGYLEKASPELFIMYASGPERSGVLPAVHHQDTVLAYLKDHAAEYEYVPGIQFRPGYYLNAYVRKGLKDTPSMVKGIQAAGSHSAGENDILSELDYFREHVSPLPYLFPAEAKTRP